MTPQERDSEFEVVWNGGPLLPSRLTKPGDTWTRPHRLYTRRPLSPLEQLVTTEDNDGVDGVDIPPSGVDTKEKETT